MRHEIVTYTGRIFDLLNPKPEMVCIEDIAHSLAYQCRYTGHTRFFYSVAQHCVLMAENSDLPGDPLQKLLHDAGEAYIGDIARPWKNLLQVRVTQHINHPVGLFESNLQNVIGEALGVELTHSAEVKEADTIMMATEIRDLMPVMPPDFKWGIDLSTVIEEKISPWSCATAEQSFIGRFNHLIEGGKYAE